MADENALVLDPAQLIAQDAPKPDRKGMILGVAAATAVALLAGAGTGWLMADLKPAAEAPSEEAAAPAAPLAYGEGVGPLVVVPVDPIVTNIASPPGTLLRVEASLVVKAGEVGDPAILAAQVSADTLAFARSLDLAQIEGARGLSHLREDLKERAMLRSPAVADYVIHSLIAQ